MTDDEFKRHLYRQMEVDKKNAGILTHRLYNNKQQTQTQNKQNTPRNPKSK